MDAITMLKNDHKTVEALFKRFEKAGDDAHAEKRAVVDQIIEELSKHAAVEEQLFYPATRQTVPGTEDIALESLEEHHIVKWVLSELDGMDPADERFDAKVTVLIENVRHHVDEEEGEYFPKVRDELGRNALNDLGEAMATAKAVAPTHPHPRAPDTPPGNIVAGTAAGVMDRVGDTVGGVAQGGVAVLSDVVATLLRRKKPRRSSDSTSAKRTTRTASRGAAKTARAATSGAKGTVTSARKGTKRTATTAKRAATSAARNSGTARSGAKATATSARKAAKRTKATAKRGATTTGRTARKAASSTKAAAKRSSRR